jgi:F-type H+-transporting ATPase subunit gamma
MFVSIDRNCSLRCVHRSRGSNARLPLYLNNQLLRALQEAAASELAVRMTAMNNASDNAKNLIGSLTLSYNKARQAAITQELLEVVAGADALN